jgi:predicted acyltransferase
VRVAEPDGTMAPLREVIYWRVFAGWAGPTAGSLLFALVFVAAWLGLLTPLHRRGLFIKV